MKIEISKGIFYNTEKTFFEQDFVVQQKVTELSSKKADVIETEMAGTHPRPLNYVWVYSTFIIEREVVYLHPADSPMNGLCTEITRVLKKI